MKKDLNYYLKSMIMMMVFCASLGSFVFAIRSMTLTDHHTAVLNSLSPTATGIALNN